MNKSKLLLAAVAGLVAGATQPATADEAKDKVNCYGVNSCGHHASCSVSAEDLAAMKKLLGDKDYDARFGKSEVHSCGSHAKCGASEKILNWNPSSAAECKEKGGYVIEGEKGKRVARKA